MKLHIPFFGNKLSQEDLLCLIRWHLLLFLWFPDFIYNLQFSKTLINNMVWQISRTLLTILTQLYRFPPKISRIADRGSVETHVLCIARVSTIYNPLVPNGVFILRSELLVISLANNSGLEDIKYFTVVTSSVSGVCFSNCVFRTFSVVNSHKWITICWKLNKIVHL